MSQLGPAPQAKDRTARTTGGVSLAVVIVSYNVRDLLRACLKATLESLAAGGFQLSVVSDQPSAVGGQPSAVSRLSSAVIVIDNASADGSAAMVAAEFPQVHLVASRENLGFAGGNNLALRMLGLDDV